MRAGKRALSVPWPRLGDLDQLERIAGTYPTRSSFLTELTLDPPEATSAEAVPPHLDEDYLVLSTIHSAKGQEWDAVFVLNVIDGCIPSDMAAGSSKQIEEERRLLYVAMTGLSGISCAAGRVNPSIHGCCEALSEEEGELGFGHGPLARRHDPLLLGTVQDQEK
jgi:superfamily I DNA/RNA helicase